MGALLHMFILLPQNEGKPNLHCLRIKKKVGGGGILPNGRTYWAWNGDRNFPILRNSVDASATGGPHGFINGDHFGNEKIPDSEITAEMLTPA